MYSQPNKLNEPRRLSAIHGWNWVNEGVRYFMQAKFIWIMTMFLVFFVTFFLVNFIPVSQLLLLFIFPFIAAGLGLACADIEKGKMMNINYLLRAFTSSNRMNLFRYGLLLLLMIFIVQMVASIIISIMGINFEQITLELNNFKDNKEASIQLLFSSPILLRYFLVTVICMLPLIAINLLSPIVIMFSELTAFQAVRISFLAVIKNLNAFVVYALVYAFILFITYVVFNLLMSLLFQLFGNDSYLAVFIYLILFVTCLLIIAVISYSSAYVAFKDIFLGDEN